MEPKQLLKRSIDSRIASLIREAKIIKGKDPEITEQEKELYRNVDAGTLLSKVYRQTPLGGVRLVSLDTEQDRLLYEEPEGLKTLSLEELGYRKVGSSYCLNVR